MRRGAVSLFSGKHGGGCAADINRSGKMVRLTAERNPKASERDNVRIRHADPAACGFRVECAVCGRFEPDRAVTRAEFAAMLVRAQAAAVLVRTLQALGWID